MHASDAAQAIRTARDRRHHFDPIACRDRIWPRAGRDKPRTPAPVGLDEGLGLVGSADAPVRAHEYLYESCPPGLESRLLKFSRWVLPVDFLNNHEIAGIDVDAFGSTEVREVAALEVGLQPMPRDLSNAFDVVQRPPPALVRMETEVVQAPMNGIRGSMQIPSEIGAGNQPDTFAEVPVLQFAPGFLKAADLDARGGPRLAEGIKVTQDRIQRWIRPAGTGTAPASAVSAGEPMPLFGRRRS